MRDSHKVDARHPVSAVDIESADGARLGGAIAHIIERLENDKFAIDNSDPIDVAWRRGWNACAKHVIGWMRGEQLTAALRELRDSPAVDMRGVVAFDLSDTESP